MYTSALKFCGAMELCGIGFPRSEPMDYQWPDVEAQVAAQKAGLVVAITRESNPNEARLMKDKGFVPVYKFTNPRTGNVGVLWLKDFTGAGGPVTRLPEYITAPNYTDPMPGLPSRMGAVLDEYIMRTDQRNVDVPRYVTYTGGVGLASSPEPSAPVVYDDGPEPGDF